MEDLLAGIQLQTEKARPGIRYIITAIEYFALISPYNLFRPIHSDNKNLGIIIYCNLVILFSHNGRNYRTNIR